MKGLIFIPDITGFTNFVETMDIDLGVAITSELLNVIIDSNPLDIEISEIEGDAVLFYKLGSPLPLASVFAAFKSMYDAFNNKYQTLKAQHNIKADLSLKFIVHYGELNVYNIKGFKKLYGRTVIESHCLLKNGDGQTNYILITNDYLQALNQTAVVVPMNNWKYSISTSKTLTGLRDINYSYYNYTNSNYLSAKACV